MDPQKLGKKTMGQSGPQKVGPYTYIYFALDPPSRVCKAPGPYRWEVLTPLPPHVRNLTQSPKKSASRGPGALEPGPLSLRALGPEAWASELGWFVWFGNGFLMAFDSFLDLLVVILL